MLDGLTKPQINRLKRYICFRCELSLDRTIRGEAGQCCSMFDRCPAAIIKSRAVECLKASRVKHIRDVSNIT